MCLRLGSHNKDTQQFNKIIIYIQAYPLIKAERNDK